VSFPFRKWFKREGRSKEPEKPLGRSLSEPSSVNANPAHESLRRARSWDGLGKMVDFISDAQSIPFPKIETEFKSEIWYQRKDIKEFGMSEIDRRKALGITSTKILIADTSEKSEEPLSRPVKARRNHSITGFPKMYSVDPQ